MKKNKGITLVALIITIIIMMILVAVSVQVIIKSGLLSSAGEAGKKYQTAAEEEATMNKINIGGTEYNSIDGYIENLCNHEYGDWKITKDPNCVETGEKIAACKLCGKIETETVPANGKHMFLGGTCSICKARGPRVGDYVNYKPEIGTYKVGSDATGYTATNPQTFTTETGLKWRILSIDEATGKLELLAKTQTTDKIYFTGATGYNHGVDILNDMCKDLYSNKEIRAVARSINIEDIQAKTTYNFNNYTSGNGKYGTTKYQITSYPTDNSKRPNLYIKELGSTSAGLNATGLKTRSEGLNNRVKDATTGISTYANTTIDAYGGYAYANSSTYATWTYVTYAPESYLRTDLGVNNPVAGIFNTGTDYWLASRCVIARSEWADFCLFEFMSSVNRVEAATLCPSTGNPQEKWAYARPVVTLFASDALTLDTVHSTDSIIYWNI